MRPSNFPQAKDFIAKVKANQEAQRLRNVEAELTAIAKELENFDETCNSDGVLKLGHNVIGRTIDAENYSTICAAGWQIGYDVESNTWLFSIRGLSSPNEV